MIFLLAIDVCKVCSKNEVFCLVSPILTPLNVTPYLCKGCLFSLKYHYCFLVSTNNDFYVSCNKRFVSYHNYTKYSVMNQYVVGLERKSYCERGTKKLYCCEEPALWGENSALTTTISDKSNIQHWFQHWFISILIVSSAPIYLKSWRKSNPITCICICICICIALSPLSI